MQATQTATLTAEQLTAAREWIADCSWADLTSEEVMELPAEQVIPAIQRHYHRGMQGFLEDCIPN